MKKLFSFLLVFALALSFYACGGNSDSNSGSDVSAGYSYDYTECNPPAFATTDTADLHYTLPNQYDTGSTYPDKTAIEIEAILFTDNGKTLTDIVAAFGYTDLTIGSTTYTSVNGSSLNQYIEKDTVNSSTLLPKGLSSSYLNDNNLDARSLYTCCPVSNMDGFSVRTKFTGSGMYYYDLSYDKFATDGYVLTVTTSPKIWWPSSYGYKGLYFCSYPYDIYMFRKIDVIRGWDSSVATFEVGATTTSYVDDTKFNSSTGLETTKFDVTTLTVTVNSQTYTDVKAISLDKFITIYIMPAADAVSSATEYEIQSLSGSATTGLAYADMEKAYFLPEYNLICTGYDSSSNTASAEIDFPTAIKVQR